MRCKFAVILCTGEDKLQTEAREETGRKTAVHDKFAGFFRNPMGSTATELPMSRLQNRFPKRKSMQYVPPFIINRR